MVTAIRHRQPSSKFSSLTEWFKRFWFQTPSNATPIPHPGVDPQKVSSDQAIPTQWEQARGIERIEMLSELAGEPAFLDQLPGLVINHYGTKVDPIMVPSILKDGPRLVGCTGFPKDSHNVVWLEVWPPGMNPHYLPGTDDGVLRCPECGQAFKMHVLPHAYSMHEVAH